MIGWAWRATGLLLLLASYWGAYEHGRTTMDAEWQVKSLDQKNEFQAERDAAAVAVINWQESEQAKRRALEEQLQSNEKAYHQVLTNAQANQARLRDRLATSDLRLSVLLATPGQGGGCGVPASTASGSVVHGGARAELDPAHAQRIISITDYGDDGLIALGACQSYIKSLAPKK